jgi:hypothetical protein
MTIDALAATEINAEGFIIKAGETIVVDKQGEKNLLLTPKGFFLIPDNYIGKVVKVYSPIGSALLS